MNTTVDPQDFGQLRARIEAVFSEAALLVITSAMRGDGKTVTAFGLAESLAETDRRVLYVDANAHAPTLARIHQLPSLGSRPEFANMSRFAKPVSGQRFMGISLADERFETVMSMDRVRAAAADMRSHFDFVIVDTAPLVKSELAVLFSALADGTLLALRLGRFPSIADDETIKILTRVGANMLGALTVTSSMIKKFSNPEVAAAKRFIVPGRHVTSRHTLEPDTSREVVEVSPFNAGS